MLQSRHAAASLLSALLLGALGSSSVQAQEKVHFTYLWHLEQPIYWPQRQTSGADRYERAWESMTRAGAHPANNLADIFGLADRVAAYQSRTRDSINAFSFGTSEAGAQISYSGGLIENIQSLASHNALGYGAGWADSIRQARSWVTLNGAAVPRADVVLFPFHHALMPLVDESTMRKQVQMYKAIYADAWGSSPAASLGFFPSEMAFSERLIPVLAGEGVQWCIVSGEKVSRACADFPVVFGSGGINCDPPNRADQRNPAQGGAAAYFRLSIDRGCSPAEAYPYAFTPHRAQYVNPSTGAVSSIIVVPASQSLGWKDGYSAQGTADFDTLQTRNPTGTGARPQLVVLAHDGDNAWGGGYSYYMEATPQRVSQARAAGYVPTVIQRYLADHPVPAADLVHVEDGAWVNADGDFGAPQFINWNWPLLNSAGQIDVLNGWHEDARNWAVITAAQNHVDTAEQIWRDGGGAVDPRRIVYPESGANAVERVWHYFCGSLNSGYMYYGTSLDMEVKPAVACNEALRLADPVITAAGPAADLTGPTIWVPQRHPWNPGSVNFGPQYGYRQTVNNGDFWVWSFVSDVSGLGSVTLKYRIDADGQLPLGGTQNETYAGGPEVGPWQGIAMTRRVFPAGNVYNNPSIDFFVMPQAIAEQCSAQITGIRSSLVDYYIEAVDTRGNIKRSPIQHVWVGDGSGAPPNGGGGSGTVVSTTPAPPVAGQSVTVSYNPAGRVLAGAATVAIHYGFNTWTGVPAVDPAMTWNAALGLWQYTLTLPITAAQFDCVFNNGAGTWDNNSGADWHIAATGALQPFVMDGVLDAGTTLIASGGGRELRVALRGTTLYVAGPNAGGGNDAFIFLARTPGALRAAQWGKAGQVAGWDAFLAGENDNTYAGWGDAGAGVAVAQGRGASGSGVLEGTIDLAAELGSATGTIYVAYANWPTANGAALLPSTQLPASVNGNTTLDAAEYIAVQLCTLAAQGCSTPPCSAADIVSIGGAPPPDGLLTGDDFLAYINAFAADDALADIVSIGGAPPPDGLVTGDDFNAFIGAFAAGCP